ncbi:DUF1403 family protein [Mesorhizobium sp. LSJC264A00]|uniref:DUF1403 family protein n=1 Tax=unclassified Mesorhizobium TaxID=325217 RepID=UPI0003F54EEC|nr:DUF1403 family protein [Mesorhizobium sp. LSJC264A00]
MPAWLRKAVETAQACAPKGLENAAIVAGAALGALDAVVRRHEKWAGAWRQRLALSAAAMTAKQAGRVEDESALRDAVLLTRPGDNVGPAGRFLLAWRRLAGTPAEKLLTAASIARVLENLGHVRDDKAVSDLADELRQLAVSAGTVGMLTGAFMAAKRHSFGRTVGAWLADALLAQRLGWTQAMPLMGAEGGFGLKSGPVPPLDKCHCGEHRG